MTTQQLRRFLSLLPSLILPILIVLGLPALSGAQQACHPDGDVDQSGSVTAADALLAFQQALGLAQLGVCQQSIADVSSDGNITASDALCIFQKALSLPSCLDSLPSSNQPPVADAGPDQVANENDLVTLSGTGSDLDGAIATYHWVQTSGTLVTLSGANTQNASFTAPEATSEDVIVEDLEFQLTVTDDDGAPATDTVVISVSHGYLFVDNDPPTADAGPDQTVDENTLVTLSGSGTDPDGFIVHYEWLQIGGTTVLLLGADTPNPSFTAPDVNFDEELVFEFTVYDDDFALATDTVTVTVLNTESNEPPVADAGADQTVDASAVVTLSGSGSDSDGVVVSYSWAQTSGTMITLPGAMTRTAHFTAPVVDSDEVLMFEFTVTDDGGASDTDTVTVTVIGEPDEVVEWPDWPVDPMTAKSIVGGLDIEEWESDAIRSELKAIEEGGISTYGSGLIHQILLRNNDIDNIEFQTVMRVQGNIPLFQARTNDKARSKWILGYGGWLDYGWFIYGSQHEESTSFMHGPSFLMTGRYKNYEYPDAVNFPIDTNWLGVMIGTDTRMSPPNVVQGTVQMTVRKDNRYDSRIEVDFSNIFDVSTGERYPDIEWSSADIGQQGGYVDSLRSAFGGEGETTGVVYDDYTLDAYITGPDGEEIVGRFDRAPLVGVLGAKRTLCIPTPCRH